MWLTTPTALFLCTFLTPDYSCYQQSFDIAVFLLSITYKLDGLYLASLIHDHGLATHALSVNITGPILVCSYAKSNAR